MASCPTQTFERGRFYLGPNGFPRFAGSASGVYLADTVRTEISPSNHHSPGIEEAFISRNNVERGSSSIARAVPRDRNGSRTRDQGRIGERQRDQARAPGAGPHWRQDQAEDKGYTPYILHVDQLVRSDEARTAITNYFSTWHPLFPFLDGGYIISQFDDAVSLANLSLPVPSFSDPPDGTMPVPQPRPAFGGMAEEEALALTAVYTSIISIGQLGMDTDTAMGRTDPVQCLPVFNSARQATMLAHLVVEASESGGVDDVLAVQALAAIELWLYLSRNLRPAMHLSGTIGKLAFEAGMHRCPERFHQIFQSPSDRDLRKRVFYSLYTLDRLLTAEFGLPIMVHDSDIDTCIPGGIERHVNEEGGDHPARTPADTVHAEREGSIGVVEESAERVPKRPRRSGSTVQSTPARVVLKPSEHTDTRLLPLFSLVSIVQLGGRAMEVFNKSIGHRSLNAQETLRLRTDLESWWNDIGLDCDEDTETSHPDPRSHYSTLFTCLYHQHIISLCRPALSLSPTTLEHAHALQTAVTSSRKTCSILHREVAEGMEVLWPGYVDMVFFSALILVYSSKRDASREKSTARLSSDLRRALRILERLAKRWANLRHFIKVLEVLVDPSRETSDPPENDTTTTEQQPSFEMFMEDPLAGDFAFDWSTLGVDSDTFWPIGSTVSGSTMFS